MTISTNENGITTITLSQEESRVFPHGVPCIRQTATRTGIIEVEVRQRVSCPNGHTLAFLRNLYHSTAQSQGSCDLTVEQVIPMLRKEQGMIEADLRRFAERVDGSVEIAELIDEKTIPSAADTVKKFRTIYDAIERAKGSDTAPRPRLLTGGESFLITDATLVGGSQIKVELRKPVTGNVSECTLVPGLVVQIGDQKLTI